MVDEQVPDAHARTLTAPIRVAFDYTRSTGPVLGAFFTALRDGKVLGGRTSDDRVVVPPLEFDPISLEPTTDFREVSDEGVVTSWSWVPEPVLGQPLGRPHALVLVTLDGATQPLLHVLNVRSPADVRTGMRVRVRWAEERVGAITDIECFEPADGTRAVSAAPVSKKGEVITGVLTPVVLDYVYAASGEESAFCRALAEGRLVGQRCPTCGKVYIPPRSACPSDGTPTSGAVELSDIGTVTTFCIVNTLYPGQKLTPPYVAAYVLLDGADIPFLHLILDIPAHEVRMGMRVRAVWKPRSEWGTTFENIRHFAPTGEPDADYETYQHHL